MKKAARTHSICAWRFATGLSGVVVKLLSELSRSRSEVADTVRVADVNALWTSIVVPVRGSGA